MILMHDDMYVPFSGTYSVQFAKFVRINNSVNVTCDFAINAPASACWIVFINSSLGIAFAGLVQHFLSHSTGLIDIPKTIVLHEVVQQLGSITFDVMVYDVSIDGDMTAYPAFEQEGGLVIKAVPDLSPGTCIIGNK